MENKKCAKCCQLRPVKLFNKSKSVKDGYSSYCKICRKLDRQKLLLKRKLIHNEKYYIMCESSVMLKTCTKCLSEKHISQFHRDFSRSDGYYYTCKDCLKAYQNKYYHSIKNTDRFLQRRSRYINDNLKKANSVPMLNLKRRLRSRIYHAFNKMGYKKRSKTKEILGEEFLVVKKHIERQFTKGMSWDNYGEWHIDHKIPLASAKTENELIELCHYRNLQPLWAQDNKSKSSKIIAHTQTFLPI